MFEIQGKVNTAICFAKVVEDAAIEQVRRMCDYALAENSRVRIMPDVHAGKGCTIGTTMTVVDKACPNVVGVDIGCGMYTVKLADTEMDFEKIDEVCHYIPSGMATWEGRLERFDLTGLRCYRSLEHSVRLERSLGTLGGGNHFIEIDKASDGSFYLVIHSGSRNLGKQVAEHYQELAIDLNKGIGEYLEAREEIIRTYKEQGRRNEIQDALKKLKWEKKNKETTLYHIGRFTFDTQKQLLSIGDKQTKLTTKENELLALLCSHANEILQRDFALKTIWIDDNYFNARSMDVYITKLRKHLKDDDQIEIINIHGKGYKLITPEED